MRPLTFFRLSLALPILLPAVGWLVGSIGHLKPLSSFLAWSLVFGGAPYLVVLGTLLFVSYKTPLARFIVWWRLSPLLMALMFGLWAAVVTLVSNGISDWHTLGFLSAWVIGGIYCVLVGYLYVALAGLVYLFFERVGVIQTDHWSSANPSHA